MPADTNGPISGTVPGTGEPFFYSKAENNRLIRGDIADLRNNAKSGFVRG